MKLSVANSAISFRLVVLRSPRADQVVRFYQALGLRFDAERHGNGPPHHACDLGHMVLEIYPAASASGDGVMLGFGAPALEPVLEAVAAAGFPAPSAPPVRPGPLLSAVLHDPDGRRVMLTRT